MRDKRKEPLRIEGKTVILEEIAPKYFPYVVNWRNNKEFNRFINQPFLLTEENEQDWYEKVYLNDDAQGLMVFVDRRMEIPFATMGWTHMNTVMRHCVQGRTMVGNLDFRGSLQFTEGRFVLCDYLYSIVDTMFTHVVKQNRKNISLNKKFGFTENQKEKQFPEECNVNGLELIEFVRTKQMYENAKTKIIKLLAGDL